MAQQQPRALTVVTADHPAIRSLATREVAAMLDNYLLGSTLTGKIMLADLMVMLTEQPKLQQCTPQSLFKCVVYAAQRKRSFGAYGVWIVPREIKGRDGAPGALMAIPQLSYQAKNTSARERGAFSIQSEVVLKGEPFTVHKDGGIIKSIDHEIDYTGRDLPTEKNVVAGYGVIQQVDGKRFYKIVTRNEINRARNTASTKRDSATPWNTDYEAMCRKTIEARMQEDYVGDFTQYGGGVAAAPAPVLEGEPQATPGGDLADALFARAEHYEPTVMERAQAMFEVCETAEQVSGLKATDAFKQLWLDASKDERDQIGSMGQQRHNELDAQARSENDDAEKQTGGGAPAGDGTVPAGGEGATPASPPVEHDGAEVQAGLDLGGEDEPTALGQPPAFPTLPESVLPFAEAKKGHPIKAVVKELRDAWSKLSEEPGSVEALLRRREAAWGGMVTTSNEVDALGSLIEVCQFVLDDVGYPSGM